MNPHSLIFSSRFIYILAMIIFLGTICPQVKAETVSKAKNPEPFLARYEVANYAPPKPAASADEYNHKVKKLTREGMAKGMPQAAAQRVAEQLASILKEPSGGLGEEVRYFGIGENRKLWGIYNKSESNTGHWPKDYMPRYILCSDKQLDYRSLVQKNRAYYQELTIYPINATNPPKEIIIKLEAVLFGFEPMAILFNGKPQVTRQANGHTLFDLTTVEDVDMKRIQKVIVDDKGRIVFSSNSRKGPRGSMSDTWVMSDFVKANNRWIPGTIERVYLVNNALWNKMSYKLIKLDVGSDVAEKWFSDRVYQATFVSDSRFYGVTVKYFTKNRLLSDEEIKQKAKTLAASKNPLHHPRKPWKTAGIFLVLLGVAILIRRFGWPKKASSQDSIQEKTKQE